MLKKILNILIILIVIAILVFVGIWCYDKYREFSTNEENEELEEIMEFVDAYLEEQANIQQNENEEENSQNSPVSSPSGGTKKQIKYKEYTIIGKIQIPKINLSYPILNESTVVSLKKGITKQYGVDPNEYGNMVIAGHNYRNGTMFSNLKKVTVGDTVKITDIGGTTVNYVVYEIYETDPNNTAHMTQDKTIRHVVLTTCNNDSSKRLIVKCKEVV